MSSKPASDGRGLHCTPIKGAAVFGIVKRLHTLIHAISQHRYGRLICNERKVQLSFEAFSYCLLPIFYATGHLDDGIIRLFVNFYFRNIDSKNRTFNNLTYTSEFIRIGNKVLSDSSFQFRAPIQACLHKNMNESVKLEPLIEFLQQHEFDTIKAKHILFFLETVLQTDVHTVPQYTLEHNSSGQV